jgi:tetraacyldisaccharide 4'-kinase
MSASRPWAWPLVPLYWAGVRAKDGLRAARAIPTRRLQKPVISIGSLSAGGAGKTPLVIALTELLTRNGWAVDVLSRGYSREGSGVQRVDLSAANPAARFGDEPVLIASATGVPVWVAARRFQAGTAAEVLSAGSTRTLHLLDDGFQHRQLARSFDIVLLTAEDLGQPMLPAGNRREPLSALRRADALVLRQEEVASIEPRLTGLLRPGTPLWSVRRSLALTESLRSQPAVAFCGIARPQGFFAMLRNEGVDLAAEIPFPDHHRYTLGDVSRVAESCHLEGCGFVTTEKDAVKLGPELRTILNARGELHIARLRTEFLDPQAVALAVEARLG